MKKLLASLPLVIVYVITMSVEVSADVINRNYRWEAQTSNPLVCLLCLLCCLGLLGLIVLLIVLMVRKNKASAPSAAPMNTSNVDNQIPVVEDKPAATTVMDTTPAQQPAEKPSTEHKKTASKKQG